MNRRNNIFLNIDWITIILYLLLVFMGWVNIYSAVYNEEHQSIFDLSQRYGKQLMWIGAAIILIFIVLIIDSKFYSAFAYILFSIGVLSLISVLFFGVEVKASKSWFQIGDFRLQPVEFVKITVCLALAQLLGSNAFSFRKTGQVLYLCLILCLPILLIFVQNDTGSALVFFSFIFVLYREGMNKALFITAFAFIALFIFALISNLEMLLIIVLCASVLGFILTNGRDKFTYIVLYTFCLFAILSMVIYFHSDLFAGNAIGLILINTAANAVVMSVLYFVRKNRNILLYLAIMLGVTAFVMSVDYIFNNVLQPHQQGRISELLGLQNDPLGIGYNVNQSKIAIGSGGLVGKGFLNGTQTKFNFVPEQSTDFIFCTIGEEWGFVGTTVVLGLFLFLILRLIYLAERQRSAFARIYGYSVVAIITFHVVINIGMTVGLAPVIGIPLPFFSYGGSSLWAFTILLFIFLKLDSDRLQIFH